MGELGWLEVVTNASAPSLYARDAFVTQSVRNTKNASNYLLIPQKGQSTLDRKPTLDNIVYKIIEGFLVNNLSIVLIFKSVIPLWEFIIGTYEVSDSKISTLSLVLSESRIVCTSSEFFGLVEQEEKRFRT